MTILTFPTLTRNPSEIAWRLQARTQTHESPFDGTQQTLALPGARWVATLTWPSLMESDRRAMEAFLAALGGRAGRFHYGPSIHAPRRGTGTGTILIAGAGQSGSELDVDGFGAAHQAFAIGDFLSYEDTTGRKRLHMATATTNADGSGAATVPIAPPIRRAGADNAAVEIAAPLGVFMLADDDVGLTTRPPLIGSVTLTIIEALA